MKKLFTAAILSLSLLGLATACKKAEAPAAVERTWDVKGEVVDLQHEGKVLIVKHEAIPDLMEAMTMGFELADPALGKTVKKGDKITFTLHNKGDEYKITAVAKEAQAVVKKSTKKTVKK